LLPDVRLPLRREIAEPGLAQELRALRRPGALRAIEDARRHDVRVGEHGVLDAERVVLPGPETTVFGC
jgi:hypothetical protein